MKTLLAIHDVEQSTDGVKPVIELAKKAEAHLNVLVFGVIQVVPVAAAPGVPAYYFSKENDELLRQGKDRVQEIERLLQDENLSASVSLECRDAALTEETILQYAMLADATVFPNQAVLATERKTRAFNGALLNSGTPVIIMGANSKNLPNVKKAMYAWNGEPEAAKAIHQSLRWLSGTIDAHIVIVDPDGNQQGPNPGDDAAAYLARQKFAVTVDRIPSGNRDVSEVLLEHAADIDADILVMGAYSHSRLRQWLLGGTTRSILQTAKLPVLMAN